MAQQTPTYTQVIDEKTGEIKYVPNNPPTPPPSEMGGKAPATEYTELSKDDIEEVRKSISGADFTTDDKLLGVLTNLMENNKRLRYNRRLQRGKLDGRSLTDYKTSERLFKQKAIKDKKYQFTFLIDTSGSMMSPHDDIDGDSRIQMSLEAVGRTVKSLNDLNIRSSIFGMNCSFRMFKGFDEDFDAEKLKNDALLALIEYYSYDGSRTNCAGGTSEWVAYEKATEYIARNSQPKTTNVVIILSDGEPGGSGRYTQVIMEGETTYVEHDGSKDYTQTLASFWNRRPEFLAFGLGIGQKAKQVPNNKQIDDMTKLPEVMGNLLTELML